MLQSRHFDVLDFDVSDFDLFLNLIKRSLLGEKADPQILECISSVSNGNIREQLEMIFRFLESGQTKISDYFWTYTIDEERTIPFHELLHSLILEDHKYFVEGEGHRFMNIFEPANKPNSSHFTGLRILRYMYVGLGQTGNLHPSEFITIDDLFAEFTIYGWTKEEIKFHVSRMLIFGLLMPESGDVSDLFDEQPFSLTKCGIYYLTHMYSNFTYFSAMAPDTGMYDQAVTSEIASLIRKNMVAAKIPLEVRIKIGELFVDYLESKERDERRGVLNRHALFSGYSFVCEITNDLKRINNMYGR